MKSRVVSVIIPVYNANKYLEKCLTSTINQTLKNIEIICIDNNSKDNSTEIIKKLQKKDNRIKLLHERQQGAGPARNKGMDYATGEYVFFLDPDDEIYSKQTLEKLYNIAKDKNMNIVGGSVEIIDANTGKETKGEDEFYFKKEGIINYKDYQYDWGFTRFIYNNQFLKGNDIKFPSYLRGEDPVFFVKAMIAANKFYAIKEPTYVYNFTHSSKKHSIQSNTDYNRSSLDVIKLAHANKLMRLEEIVKKHDRPLVSIIIPVYSTAPDHLHRCFTSILNQAYSNTEVIIVDDGSNKKTAKFIDSFIKHTQWKLIRQENKGLSAARNAGYKVAAGKYIQFLDSDDYFDRYLIAYGVEFAKKDDADIVIENFTIKTADTGDERDVLDLGRLPNKTTFRLKQIEDNKLDTIAFSVWSKLFKKSFLDKHNILHDEELFRAEDVLYSLTALILADKITVLPKSLITYLEDMPGSNTATNDKHATASVKSWDKLHSFLIDKKLFEFYRKDFESAALGSITWSLDRMYTLNGIQELGIVASRFINNLNFDTSDTRVVLLKVASKCPEAILLLRKKDKELLEKDAHIIKQNEKINSVESELLSYLGIKRSVKLTAGNIKRRIKKLLR